MLIKVAEADSVISQSPPAIIENKIADPDYQPNCSENLTGKSIKGSNYLCEKKIVVFESMLDVLLTKIKCEHGCPTTKEHLSKRYMGTSWHVIITCINGHGSTQMGSSADCWENALFNIIYSAAIFFSGNKVYRCCQNIFSHFLKNHTLKFQMLHTRRFANLQSTLGFKQ